MTRTCSVPGCFTTLSLITTSAVCRQHNHAVGFCRCTGCLRKQKSEHAALRETLTTVRPSTSVTLPRAPWDE